MSLILTFLIRSLIWRIPGMRLLATAAVLAASGGIFLYILFALALVQIARNRQVRAPWLAWIPVANLYTLGACADDERGGVRYAVLCPGLLGGAVICMAAAYFRGGEDVFAAGPLLVAIALGLAAAALVLAYIALNWVYRSVSRSPTALTVLSVIFGFLIPIFLFVLRNRLSGGGRMPRSAAPGD